MTLLTRFRNLTQQGKECIIFSGPQNEAHQFKLPNFISYQEVHQDNVSETKARVFSLIAPYLCAHDLFSWMIACKKHFNDLCMIRDVLHEKILDYVSGQQTYIISNKPSLYTFLFLQKLPSHFYLTSRLYQDYITQDDALGRKENDLFSAAGFIALENRTSVKNVNYKFTAMDVIDSLPFLTSLTFNIQTRDQLKELLKSDICLALMREVIIATPGMLSTYLENTVDWGIYLRDYGAENTQNFLTFLHKSANLEKLVIRSDKIFPPSLEGLKENSLLNLRILVIETGYLTVEKLHLLLNAAPNLEELVLSCAYMNVENIFLTLEKDSLPCLHRLILPALLPELPQLSHMESDIRQENVRAIKQAAPKLKILMTGAGTNINYLEVFPN